MTTDVGSLPRVLLIGKPNSGKTLLFNRLTGMNQKVANFPGVTVEVKRSQTNDFEYVDLPGLYSLDAISADERIAIEQLHKAMAGEGQSVVLCVLDSTRLERSLVLGLEARNAARSAGLPFIYALNMSDELQKLGLSIDVSGLSRELGHEIIPISARTREGIDSLKNRLSEISSTPRKEIENLAAVPTNADCPMVAKDLASRFAPSSEKILSRQTRFDHVLLHDFFGIAFFLIVMSVLFQAVFTWAAPLMDMTKVALEFIGSRTAALMPYVILGDFVKDGLLGGISAVLVFVPQIALLTFLIGILEDSGYLARAAMLCHRPLSIVGLSGKSFVPLLSGHACAIPAIMAARTIESPRARWLTWIAIPLMSCSARLPVYGVLIAAIIPNTTFFGGVFGLRGFTLLALYGFGISSGLLVSGLVNRVTPKGFMKSLPFVLELPPYRLPAWKPLFLRAVISCKTFVLRAGSTIFAVSLVVWLLGYFPYGAGKLEDSYLSHLGRLVSPLFAPLGLDWKFTVAVMTSFLAREVFVGTLGVLFGIEDATERTDAMAARIHESGLSLASGLALLVFFAVSLQCVSTLAVLRKESGSKNLPFVMMIAYAIAAYLLALGTFAGVSALTV